jgi:hypothetical protein
MEEIKKALFYVASLIALLRKLMFKQKKYFALEGKEKRKTKSQKDLRERAKELRSIGIKGKKREINIEDIDAFFMQRFGRSYSELLGLFKDVKKICAPIKHFFGLKDHAVIFPLTGQLFNYYVAKGILQEMQRFENKKGPILLTLVTMAEIYHYSFDSNGHYETDYKKTRMIQEGLKKQIEKIIKKHKLESISVIDKFVLQRTIDQIRDQFKKYNVPLNRTTNVDEHQIIGRMVPFELINKSLSGKAIPLSHSKKNE